MAVLNRMSIRATLSVIIGGMALLLVAASLQALGDAYARHQAAEHVASLTGASRHLFTSLVNTRLERGTFASALLADGVLDDAGQARAAASRTLAEQSYGDAIRLLAAAGYGSQSPSVQELSTAHEAVAAIRPAMDTAVRQAKATRDPQIVRSGPKIMQEFLDRIVATGDMVEASLKLTDAGVDQLLAVKRAAWAMRSYAGLATFAAQTAVASGRPWGPAEIAAMARDQGRSLLAWSMLTEAASRADAPEPLVAAVAATNQIYFGYVNTRQKPVFARLMTGQLPAITVTELLKADIAALAPIATVADVALDLMVARSEEQKAASRLGLIVHSAQLLVALAFTVAGFIVARHRVSRPIQGMTLAMRRLAEHDTTVAIPGGARHDEIGAMAAAVSVFRDTMVDAVRLGNEQQAEQVLKEQRAGRLEELVHGFETKVGYLVGMLSAASTEMEATAQSMSSTATMTDQQASTVADAAEQTSIGVQTVASAAEQLTASITEISRQVAQSAVITNTAVGEARRTDGLVRTLADAAEKIGAVVGLITNIATQTNLLALNATIEAARAGDAGKGFAVVASEVKGLAGQTARATKEIAEQIKQIQTATQQAVTAIGAIAVTIEEVSGIANSIASAVEQQGAATAEIARNVQQTSASTRDVTSNITGVSKGANDTGAAASQVLSAAGDLSRQANDLSAEVERFVSSVRAA